MPFNKPHTTAYCFLFLLLGSQAFQVSAQENFESIEDLKDKAEELFEEKEFVKAMPLYSQLLSHKPEHPLYNYKYGVCALHGQADKKVPLKHLRYSADKEDVPPAVHYYLGRTYHLNYRFGKAIEAYNSFQEKGDPDELPVEQKLRMARNGKELMEKANELVVLDKTRTGTEEFFRYYEPQGVKGKILVAPENIMFEADKERNERSIIFFPTGSNTIFYASYGEDGENGKDIYQVKQLPNGEWAKPQKLKGEVNTKFDEDYPFKPPNSRDLYFCSKGHNSMGGYDIFRSEYDEETGTYGPPENLDFPINSPDDDILYLADEKERKAYFASGRSSDAEHLHVYKVRIEKIPMKTKILKGKFRNLLDTSKSKARITVKDVKTGKKLGVYNSSPKNGDYLITVPRSGKYEFTVKPASSERSYKGTVQVPELEEIRPLKQALVLTREEGEERLLIKNKFDERFENEEAIVSQVMKKKGELNVNDSEAMREKLEEAQKKDADSLPSEEQLISKAKQKAEELKKEAEKLETKKKEAYATADKERKAASKASEEAEHALQEAKAAEDPEVRARKLAEADSAQKRASTKGQKARTAYELAQDLGDKAKEKREAARKAESYATELQKALRQGSKEKALKKTADRKEAIEKELKSGPQKEEALASIREDAEELEEKADRELERGQAKKARIKEIEERLAMLERRIPNASGDEEEELKAERKELKKEEQQLRAEADSAFAEADRIQTRAERKKARAELLEEIQEQEGKTPGSQGGRTWTASEREELERKLQETQKRTRERAEDPLLAKHRKEEGEAGTNDASREGKGDSIGEQKEKGTGSSGRSGTASFDHEESDPIVKREIEEKAPDYGSDIQRIQEDEELSEKEKEERILDRKEELSRTLRESIQTKEQKLEEVSDPEEREKLNEELQELRQARKELSRELKRKGRGETLQAERAEEGRRGSGNSSGEAGSVGYRIEEKAPETRETLRELDPSYEEDLRSIQNDGSLSATEKERKVRKREKELLQRIDEAVGQKERQLQRIDEPERKKEIQQELEFLRNARSDLKEQRRDRRGKLAAGSENEEGNEGGRRRIGEEGSSGMESDIDEEERRMLRATAPSYREDIRKIEASDRSRPEKDLKRAERTEELVEDLEKRIEERTEALQRQNDPEKIQSTSRDLEKLRSLRDKKKKEAERFRARAIGEDPLAQEKGEERREESSSEQREKSLTESQVNKAIGKVDPSYQEDMEEIVSSTEPGSQEYFRRKTAREEEAHGKLKTHIDSLREELSESNDDEERKELFERIDKLEKVEDRSKTRKKSYEAYAEEGQEGEEDPARSIRQELQKDIEALNASELSQKKKRSTKRERRKKALERVDRAIEQEKRIKKNAPSNVKKKARKRIRKLKTYRKELQKELDRSSASEGKSPSGTEGENSRARAERILARESQGKSAGGTSDERMEGGTKELAERKARDAQAFANEKRSEASRILQGEKGGGDESISPSDRVRGLVLQQKADSADRMAEAFQDLAQGRGKKSEAEEKIGGEVLAVENEEDGESSEENAGQGSNSEREKDEEGNAQEGSSEKGADRNESTDSSGDASEKEPEQESNEERTSTGEGTRGGSNEERTSTGEGSGGESSGGTEGKEGIEGLSPSIINVEDPSIIENSEGDVFAETENAAYSEENPIPKDPGMPDGVIYQVQVGAFSNPIPQDHFKGFAPLIAKTGEDGITRYRAGFFKELDNAEEARDQIQQKGYSDAFVVAYEGGKRITVSEARAKLEGKALADRGGAESKDGGTNADREGDNASSGGGASGAGAEEEGEASADPERTGVAKGRIENMKGLFFTVQVGVYSELLQRAGPLQGIAPLYVKRTSNGNYRYSTGVFPSVSDARSKESRVKENAVPDAFITAYYDGERITVDRAQELLEKKGQGILYKESGTPGRRRSVADRSENEESGPSSGGSEKEQEELEREEPSGDEGEGSTGELTGDDIDIKVDLGTYAKVPEKVATIIRNSSGEGIEERITAEGDTNYRTKAYRNLREAHLVRHRFDQMGIDSAEVITMAYGELISRRKAVKAIDRSKERSNDSDEKKGKEDTATGKSTPYRAAGKVAPEDIVIRVDLGTYKGKVPNDVAKTILNSNEEGIQERTTEEGHTNYRTKPYDSFRAANQVRHKFVKRGIEKTKIITLVDGKKIPTERAARIIRNAE